jgi:hypothetical protein
VSGPIPSDQITEAAEHATEIALDLFSVAAVHGHLALAFTTLPPLESVAVNFKRQTPKQTRLLRLL